ncbi:hypothetical protein L226DRAFT_549426 [Lentinus tigrinus ALCF2SS1-7]|uniref:Uncharacterized protein n=1 Tax=Lentinus tigrinus ALCF2SS1-6 TaxID=1328759 RepID=A0A5C2STH2_9APHY|nr:hypothetical protein L227DRAFT_518987 [Lentinus tigrinus ALCF2SS1-6]RPD82860.1 hypothetical protein L226DRAFT_549426 [Lentinus tigrinus ALCF2SS1-7]
MRRAQSVRHYAKSSLAIGADDLGVLKEDESVEDVLRRQLLDKDRECDRLQIQIQSLQAQLAQRPPLEKIQALEKEYTHLELILQGTQRENERCMAELERGKVREKMLERELEKLAGANWQTNLDIAPASASGFHARAAGLVNSGKSSSPAKEKSSLSASTSDASQSQASIEATKAYLEQVRLAILGMEQRMQSREDKLAKHIERAEAEGARFEEIRKQVLPASSS